MKRIYIVASTEEGFEKAKEQIDLQDADEVIHISRFIDMHRIIRSDYELYYVENDMQRFPVSILTLIEVVHHGKKVTV